MVRGGLAGGFRGNYGRGAMRRGNSWGNNFRGGGGGGGQRWGNTYALRSSRGASFNGGYRATSRLGILRRRGGGEGSLRQRTGGAAADRRIGPSRGGFYSAIGPRRSTFRGRGSRRGARGGGGVRGGRGRGRRGRGGRARTNETDLDAQLDEYMGEGAAKVRLDSQLDAYFGRPVTTVSEKVDPLSDAGDVNMAGATSRGTT